MCVCVSNTYSTNFLYGDFERALTEHARIHKQFE